MKTDKTPLEDRTFQTIGCAIVNIIARGHTVEIAPLISSREPHFYSVAVPGVSFLGQSSLSGLSEVLTEALRKI